MKLNLNELYELVLFSVNKHTHLQEAALKLMHAKVVEPIEQGVLESNKFDSSFFHDNNDILEGIDFLEETGADMNEEFEFNFL